MKKSKIIKLCIALIILIGLSIWIKSRWGAWFHSLPETEYSFASNPDRITLLPGSDFNESRIITWRCDTVMRKSGIEVCGNNTSAEIEAVGTLVENTGGKDIFYKAQINDLVADSIYKYRVYSGRDTSNWYSFKASSKEGIKKFVYIGDVQDTLGGHIKPILQNIYTRNRDTDAILFGGDLLEGPIDAHWNYVYNNIDSLVQQIPIIATAGNHEYRKSLLPYLDYRWRHSFAYDDNGPSKCPGTYFINSANVLIMVIDTQGFVRGYPILSQAMWLNSVIEKWGSGKLKILMMHHPIYSVREGKKNFWESHLYKSIVEDKHIDIVLAGHEHGYGRSFSTNPFYVVSHCSPKVYKSKASDEFMQIIPDKKTYQVFEISKSNVSYQCFDAETNQILDKVIINRNTK